MKAASALLCWLLLAGCRQDMHDQPKIRPLRGSTLFADGRGARDPVAGTVARGHLEADRLYYQGHRTIPAARAADDLGDAFPFAVGRAELERGRERYDIFCSPCHARTGAGDGMVVQRGYRRPPALWDDKLRGAPVGHFFDVISNGFGAMPAYASQVPPRDRWCVIAYLRALQLAHHAELDALPASERERAVAALSGSQQAGAPARGGSP